MNLQRLPEYAIRWIATAGGMLLAIYLARSAGNGQTGFVAGVLAIIVGIGLVLAVREKIWVLVPIAWGLTGQIPSLALPFSVRDLIVLFVFVAFLPLKAFKILRRKPTFEHNDILIVVMATYLLISYMRNPVGVDALDSDRVGGRPYFNCLIGCLAYWILSQVAVSAKKANTLALAVVSGRVVEGVLAQFLAWFPSLFFFFASYYTCGYFVGVVEDVGFIAPGAESTGRLAYLSVIGLPLLTYLFALKPIGKLINPFHFWWPLLLGLGFVCVLLSGFRSILFACMAALAIATYIRNGWHSIGRLGLLVCLTLLIVILGNGRAFDLPRSTQRALSWLPGKWDEFATLEAKDSTKWRTYMWGQMLLTDRYIQNKVLGDGFGFSKRDYTKMQYFAKYGSGADGQENFMISGGVHSGPVSAIRHGGGVGLCLLLIILVMQARESWRIIRIAFPTPFRTLTLFVCVPIVFEPFFFTVIFGAYENASPDCFYTLGMLRMLGNSLQIHKANTHHDGTASSAASLAQTTRPTLPEFAQPVAKLMIPPAA